MNTAIYAARKPNLWLPISYQSHYTRLLDAADKVRHLDDCYELITGTMSERLSSKHHIVFTFHCRTRERKKFVVTLDAKTLTVTNMLDVWREQAAKEEKRQQQENLRKKLAERSQYWAVCQQAFNDKTQSFNQPKITSEVPPRPDVTVEGVLTYIIEFQTLSLKKRSLSYIATAVIENLDKCEIKIRPV